MSDQTGSPVDGRSVKGFTKPTLRRCLLAIALIGVYLALFALFIHLASSHIDDYWPHWVLWIAGVIWFAIMMVLPFVIVKLFGLDLNPIWQPYRRFTLRKMFVQVMWISFFMWFFTQTYWKLQRMSWRNSNRATVNFTQGEAPFALRLFGESGEERIVIKKGTKQQVAEAKRLFPEAEVIVEGEAADAANK
jgi:hypothetical protein